MLSPTALAVEYPVPIEVEDEDEILQLYYDGNLDEDQRDRLLTIYASKVDLNQAGRDELYELPGITYAMADAIIAYRERVGPFGEVTDLRAVAEVPLDVFEQVRSFVAAVAPKRPRRFGGVAEAGGLGRTEQGNLPAFYLRLRADAWEHAHAGILFTVRPLLGDVEYSPTWGSLAADGEQERPRLEHFYLSWDGPRLAVLGGSYRIGFGQRLVLDNTRMERPHGFIANNAFYTNNDSGTLTPIRGFVGLAVRGRYLPVGSGWFDATAFGSFWNQDLYYTDITYQRGEDQPFIVDDEGQSIPYATLPSILREGVAGGNLSYNYDRRSGVGVTGYFADIKVNADAPDIRAALSAVYPEDRTRFGAVGLDARYGRGWADTALDLAVTDRGAPAVVARAWLDPLPNLEIIPSLRYYSPDFDNPYARGEAYADEYLGNRARDELGGRLRVVWRPWPWLRLRADINVWRSENPLLYDQDGKVIAGLGYATIDTRNLLRLDFMPTKREQLSLFVVYQDEDVGGEAAEMEEGDLPPPSGQRWQLAARVETRRLRRLTFTAFYKHTLEHSASFRDSWDPSWYVWLRVRADLRPGPSLLLRLKYYDEYTATIPARSQNSRECDWEASGAGMAGQPVPGECRGETYLEAYLQATQKLWSGSFLRLRVGVTHYFDHRTSWDPVPTASNPEPVIPGRTDVLIKGTLVACF